MEVAVVLIPEIRFGTLCHVAGCTPVCSVIGCTARPENLVAQLGASPHKAHTRHSRCACRKPQCSTTPSTFDSGSRLMLTKLDAKGLEAAALKRGLDLTINQRLDVKFTDREGGGLSQARKSMDVNEREISSFARFLSQNLCLEVLLFWKEVEQYKTLFSVEERQALFSKIYELYCIEGAHWQVNFKGQHVEDMSKHINSEKTISDDLPEEVFDAAQHEVYELMRLDLYPRFKEHMADSGLADEVVAESMSQVLSGINPPATRSFMRFARDELCEEALLFWLEANDYALLFQKMDQISHAQAIYDTYMSPKAKFKVNVADAKIKAVATALANKDVNNALFVSSQKEVGTFMEQDLFPRYETWAKHEGKRKESKAAGGELAKLLDEGRLGNRKAMREALVALIDIPHQQELLRDSARKLDAEEALDFYVDCKKYALLFNEQDRRETAQRLWMRYLDAKADRLVNVPDQISRQLQKDIFEKKSSDPKLFKKAEEDVLNLMTDNIYPSFIKAQSSPSSDSTSTVVPIAAKRASRCIIC